MSYNTIIGENPQFRLVIETAAKVAALDTPVLITGESGTGKEMLALIEEMKAALPKLDTSSKEAYESSLEKMKAGLPKSKVSTFNDWLKEMPAYRKGNQKIESLNGMTFQKIVENRDFVNSQNPAAKN